MVRFHCQSRVAKLNDTIESIYMIAAKFFVNMHASRLAETALARVGKLADSHYN